MRLFRILAICSLVFWWTFLPTDSASASCVTTAQSVATASESATLLAPSESGTATTASTPVIVQDTCGGDDVSYQVALPSAIDNELLFIAASTFAVELLAWHDPIAKSTGVP